MDPAKVIAPRLSINTKHVFKWVKGEVIGKGTYGAVYIAVNATAGELIAAKQVEVPKTSSEQNDNKQAQISDIVAENDMLKDLDHPNIVQYLGFEQSADYFTIFFEYIPGGSIGNCLGKCKFNRDVVRSFTSQILAGLEYLHSQGISHRNLTVDNVLLLPSGVCKISVNGSGEGYNAKRDIWYLGCVVLEMWASRRLWDQNSINLQFEQTAVPPVPDDVILDDLEDDFRRKCFAVDGDGPTTWELKKHAFLELKPGYTFRGLSQGLQ